MADERSVLWQIEHLSEGLFLEGDFLSLTLQEELKSGLLPLKEALQQFKKAKINLEEMTQHVKVNTFP